MSCPPSLKTVCVEILEGQRGAQGPQGVQGIQGPSGPVGASGLSIKGDTGEASTVSGPQGATGASGLSVKGDTGERGEKGATGQQGVQGSQGVQGNQGEVGATGASGARGSTGAVGASGLSVVGSTGSTGPAGEASTVAGPTGATGPMPYNYKGAWDNFASYSLYDAVTHLGSLWWLPATGGWTVGGAPPGYNWELLVSAGATGATGADSTVSGPQGSTGATGPASTVSGPQGATGATGAASTVSGPQGSTGATGPAGVADKYYGTSTTTLTVGNGSKTLNTQAGLSYSLGQPVTIAYPGNGEHMHGVVVSYNQTSGVLVADISHHTGHGTWSNWIVNLEGVAGVAGATGATGAASTVSGPQGATGATGPAGSASDRLTSPDLSQEVVLDNAGGITLPAGGTIEDSASAEGSITLTPPNAVAGQALVIRPTVGTSLTNDVPFAAGATIVVTLTDAGTHISEDKTAQGGEDASWPFTITGISAGNLGSALTGTFLAADWVFGNGNPTNVKTFNIPAESTGTGFTITLDELITQDGNIYPGYPLNGILTLTVGSVVSEATTGHLHLVAADPVNIDIYLGDDNQYVKVQRNNGDIVIGNNDNSNQWTFGTDGNLELPIGGDIVDSTGASVLGQTLQSFAWDLTTSSGVALETLAINGFTTDDIPALYHVSIDGINQHAGAYTLSAGVMTFSETVDAAANVEIKRPKLI